MEVTELEVVRPLRGEDRHDRSRRIPWFDLERTRSSNVLVVGAGALGNEVVKNLVLAGAGSIALVDMDRVVRSNLNRCVFFSEQDATSGRMKAEVVAQAASRLDPQVRIEPHTERIEDLGEGVFEGRDVVLGCLDNLAARVHVNANCYYLGVPYVDGGTMGLMGKVQVVVPPRSSCVECTLNSSHYRIMEQRYSCTGAGLTYVEPKLASEVTTTSVIAAVQAREAMKLINGRADLVLANLFYYDGNRNVADVLEVAVNPGCPNHSAAGTHRAARDARGVLGTEGAEGAQGARGRGG